MSKSQFEYEKIPSTQVVQNQGDTLGKLVAAIQNSNWLYGCSSFPSLRMIGEIIDVPLSKVLKQCKEGKHKGVRWIGTIETYDDIKIVKKYLQLGIEIKHLNAIPVNFVVTDKGFNLTIDNVLDGKLSLPTHALVSNDRAYLDHFNSLFDRLWNDRASITASDRILEIEEGVEPEEIRILSDPLEVQKLYIHLLGTAVSEISIIIATPNALHRAQKFGVIDLLNRAASNRGVKVSLIIPSSEDQRRDSTAIGNYLPFSSEIEELTTVCPNFEVRRNVPYIQQSSKIKSTFLIIDRLSSLIVDLKDDSKDDFMDATGYATFSSSKSRTQSYSFIFDTIWRQAELYEKLEQHDLMQREFINIAAHELRTPAQAIIGYTEMINCFPEKKQDYQNAISRNAERLTRLAADILDVARIESSTLKIDKSEFNLVAVIRSVMNDIMGSNILESKDNTKIIFEQEQPITVRADKLRIYQVISNLLNNSLKFTADGTISIESEIVSPDKIVKVTITDTGKGIDKEIMPRLFTKFASKSNKGTGLGLFIAKSIIEAHGGKIRAYNNQDRPGATISFILPLDPMDKN